MYEKAEPNKCDQVWGRLTYHKQMPQLEFPGDKEK